MPRSGLSFPRSHRLTRGSDIQRIGQKGKRIRTRHLEVRMLASPLLHPRVGFVVPKYGFTAVERNRLKRRLREIVRVRVLRTLVPVDVVVKAHRNAYGASFDVLADELMESVAKQERPSEA